MKRMLIDGMTGNMGGIEKFIYTVYKAFQTQYQIDFMTVDGHIPFEEEFLENGSRIHRITPRYVSAKTYKADIDKVFSENSYDILWFNKTTLSSIECLKSAKRHNVKKIICHSHASKNMGNFLTRIMHEFNKNKIERYVDYKLACSVEAASWFYGDKTDDVEIFNNAVDLKKYSPSLEFLIKKKKELGLEGKFVLGHIGRFSVEKNHKFLLDVFEAVSKETDAHLVLCGEGALLSEIKEYAVQKGLGEKSLLWV